MNHTHLNTEIKNQVTSWMLVLIIQWTNYFNSQIILSRVTELFYRINRRGKRLYIENYHINQLYIYICMQDFYLGTVGYYDTRNYFKTSTDFSGLI